MNNKIKIIILFFQIFLSGCGSEFEILLHDPEPVIYWSEENSGKICSINPDRTDKKTIITVPHPVLDIDIDIRKDRIFWLEYTGTRFQIKRSGINGRGEIIVYYNSLPDAGPTAIAIDNSSGTILWNEYKNSNNRNDIWKSGNTADTLSPVMWESDIQDDYMYSICVDSINRRIYFTVNLSWNNGHSLGGSTSGGGVYMSDLDNDFTHHLEIPGTGTPAFRGIAVDGEEGYVYYARNTGSVDIMRADLFLNNSVLWIPSSGFYINKIALDLQNRKIYWTSKIDSSIYRADLDVPDSNVEKFLDLGAGVIPTGIAILQE